jgi:hypothetical protein
MDFPQIYCCMIFEYILLKFVILEVYDVKILEFDGT